MLAKLVDVLRFVRPSADESSSSFLHLLLTLILNIATNNQLNQIFIWEKLPLGSISAIGRRLEALVPVREIFYIFVMNTITANESHQYALSLSFYFVKIYYVIEFNLYL